MTPHIGFITLSVIFVAATLARLCQPFAVGGLGVFDAAMLVALWQFDKEELLAGLLLFRLLYYIVPFALALAILGGREIIKGSLHNARSATCNHHRRCAGRAGGTESNGEQSGGPKSRPTAMDQNSDQGSFIARLGEKAGRHALWIMAALAVIVIAIPFIGGALRFAVAFPLIVILIAAAWRPRPPARPAVCVAIGGAALAKPRMIISLPM